MLSGAEASTPAVRHFSADDPDAVVRCEIGARCRSDGKGKRAPRNGIDVGRVGSAPGVDDANVQRKMGTISAPHEEVGTPTHPVGSHLPGHDVSPARTRTVGGV